MITDAVLKAYVKAVRTALPTSYAVFDRAFYDQDLNFERVRENFLNEDKAFKALSGNTNGNWVVFVYNRGPINRTNVVGRQMTAKELNIDQTAAHLYGWAYASTPLSIKMFSPSIPMMEAIEEYYTAFPLPNQVVVPVKLPPSNLTYNIEGSLDLAVPQVIVKLEEATKGSLSTLQLDFQMNYVVIVHKETKPVITSVTLDVYIGDEPNAEARDIRITATAPP